MSVKTKVPIVMIAAVVAALFLANNAKSTKEYRNELTVALEYVWLAGPSKPVRVEVKDLNQGGRMITKTNHAPASWSRVIKVNPGALVEFRTYPPEGGIFSMGCIIFDTNGNTHDSKDLFTHEPFLECLASIL